MLVEKLVGHRAACNTIAWNPANPTMFASCGDDGILRMYVFSLMASMSSLFLTLSRWSSRRVTEDVQSNETGSERGSIDW